MMVIAVMLSDYTAGNYDDDVMVMIVKNKAADMDADMRKMNLRAMQLMVMTGIELLGRMIILSWLFTLLLNVIVLCFFVACSLCWLLCESSQRVEQFSLFKSY